MAPAPNVGYIKAGGTAMMRSQADITGTRLRSSGTGLRAWRGLRELHAQRGLDRMWGEVAIRSLGLQGDEPSPLRDPQPSWNRIAWLLLDSGLSTF